MTRKNKIIIAIFCFFGAFLAVHFVGAADFGLVEVGNGLGGTLSSDDPRLMVGRVIQIILSFLGVIAVLLVMYAGFLWMSSDGEEEKIRNAKTILRNASIGLLIVLSAWGITTFIISRLSDAIGGTGGSGGNNGGSGFSNPGIGAIGACTIESVYPVNNQQDLPRNTSVMLSFKEELRSDNLCVDSTGSSCACNNTDCNKINPTVIHLYRKDLGDSCSNSSCSNPNSNLTDIIISLSSDKKTLVLMPIELLGASSGNTAYSIKFTNQVRKADGSSMFKNCHADFAQWDFTVSSSIDLSPPFIPRAGIFPLPDNEKDVFQESKPAVAATASIAVNDCPKIYQAAKVNNISPIGPSPADVSVALNYHGDLTGFKVVIPAGFPNKAQLFDVSGNSLGVADFNQAGQAIFNNYLSFSSVNRAEGNAWNISIIPEQLADTLNVDNVNYVFSASNENNNIKVPDICNQENQAANIQAKLSGQAVFEVERTANVVRLIARVAGEEGNDILLTTSNASALAVSPFAGGQDRQNLSQTKDRKDRPMNSAIQINFNEAVNPLTVSGSASELAKYIRVVNANASSTLANSTCTKDSDCRSYKCEANKCIGDYLGGKFVVSNNYRTVEFVSDRECGLNGCGEKIYCLPANSHLSVELSAADLKTCSSNNDCVSYSPFMTCAATRLSYKTCQNSINKNYPAASPELNGIVDAAANSLDGDRSGFADGPISFYDDNYSASSTVNIGQQDKYKWSFYINDKIMIQSPQISNITPIQGEGDIALTEPIQIKFNVLMLNSTLRTGSTFISNGTSSVEHKLINLRSASNNALGYWILSDNLDTDPLDGEPDITIARISHSAFSQSTTFKAQVGSGVKDIYQNCFKPSAGPDCQANAEKPSCCFGSPTGTLGADGNCQ